MGVAKGVGRGASRPGKPQIFCIIVNRTDAPHFEYLRRNAPSVDHKWGLRDYDRKAWEEVKPNDLVYMDIRLGDDPAVRARGRHRPRS